MDKKTTEEHPILATKGQTLVYAQPQLATTETKSPLLTLGHKTANKKEIVPERAQEEVIRRHHDRLLHGHPGQDKTLEKIQRNYHFDRMKRKVTEFIRNCEQCAKNKPSRHKPYGQAQQIDLPKTLWETIMMDFVVKLPNVVVCTVLSYPSIGLGREVEGGLVLAGEECQGAQRGLVEHGGGDT